MESAIERPEVFEPKWKKIDGAPPRGSPVIGCIGQDYPTVAYQTMVALQQCYEHPSSKEFY